MKRRTTFGSLAVVAMACIAVVIALSASRRATGANAPGATPAPSPIEPTHGPGKLTVHEWGTFTGFSTSEGVHLPFSSAIGTDLPLFVYNRPAQAARLKSTGPREPAGAPELPGVSLLLGKSGMLSTQRMETPVIYFYTDAPRDVDVRVDFPKGLITEFYPPVRGMGPAYPQPNGETLADSFLSWGKVHLAPDTGAAGVASAASADRPGAHIPPVEQNAHYAHARETDSAIVRFDDGRSRQPAEEKFLFYRGLGNCTLPVTLRSDGDDRFTLLAGPDPIHSAFLIRIEGDRVRFSRYTDLRGNRPLELPAESRPNADLSDAVAKALVAEGLYEREARAMVRTWEDSWFREAGTGTRLLYTIPRPATDALLPLAIQPTPDELVRVMVGRVDVMTREQEARIAALLTRPTDRAGLTVEEARELKALGRFLSPAVDHVADQQSRKLIQAAYAVPEK
jgi:hypothetical protein